MPLVGNKNGPRRNGLGYSYNMCDFVCLASCSADR